MAEQEQVVSKDESQDVANSQSAPADEDEAPVPPKTGPADETSASEAVESDPDGTPAPPSDEGTSGDPASAASAEAPDQEGGESEAPEPPPEPPEEPGFVSRILEEAVEDASEDLTIPTGDEASLDVSDFEEPTRTVSPDELERTEEAQGFTGDTYGETVSLDEIESDEGAYADDPVYDQFRQVVDQTAIDVREQDIVEGRVLRGTMPSLL